MHTRQLNWLVSRKERRVLSWEGIVDVAYASHIHHLLLRGRLSAVNVHWLVLWHRQHTLPTLLVCVVKHSLYGYSEMTYRIRVGDIVACLEWRQLANELLRPSFLVNRWLGVLHVLDRGNNFGKFDLVLSSFKIDIAGIGVALFLHQSRANLKTPLALHVRALASFQFIQDCLLPTDQQQSLLLLLVSILVSRLGISEKRLKVCSRLRAPRQVINVQDLESVFRLLADSWLIFRFLLLLILILLNRHGLVDTLSKFFISRLILSLWFVSNFAHRMHWLRCLMLMPGFVERA